MALIEHKSHSSIWRVGFYMDHLQGAAWGRRARFAACIIGILEVVAGLVVLVPPNCD